MHAFLLTHSYWLHKRRFYEEKQQIWQIPTEINFQIWAASIITAESSICLIHQGWSEAFFILFTQLKLGMPVKPHSSVSWVMSIFVPCALLTVSSAEGGECALYKVSARVWVLSGRVHVPYPKDHLPLPHTAAAEISWKISSRKSRNVNYGVVLPIAPVAHSLCPLELPFLFSHPLQRNGNSWAGLWLLAF